MKSNFLFVLIVLIGCAKYPKGLRPEFANIREKDSAEIEYIVSCFRENKSIDSLVSWNKKTSIEPLFEFKGRVVLFKLDSSENCIKSIHYYKNSFYKRMYNHENECEFPLNDKLKIGVWGSKDYLSAYICVYDAQSINIFVLSNGNHVYRFRTDFN